MNPLAFGFETDFHAVDVIDILIGINLFQLRQNLVNQRFVSKLDLVFRDMVLRISLFEFRNGHFLVSEVGEEQCDADHGITS